MIAAAPITYRSRFDVCANPDCPRPGRRFLKTNRNQRYCSEECRRADRFGTHICPGCGREFVPDRDNRVYHSRECYERSVN